MDTNNIALVQTVAIFLALFGFWWRLDSKINSLDAKLTNQNKDLDARLSGEIKEVRQASEEAHKEIISRLNAVERTQATHSERFNTIGERFNTLDERFNAINERFNTVQTQIQAVDDKVGRLRDER